VVKSNQTHKDAAATIWLTYDGQVRECVRPSTASPVPRVVSSVLMLQVSFS